MSAQPKGFTFTVLNVARPLVGRNSRSSTPRRSASRKFIWIEISLALSIVALSLLTFVVPASAHGTAVLPGDGHHVFLPMVTSFSITPASTEPVCGLTAEEEAIAKRMLEEPSQGRSTLHCDPILAQVAREHAQDMGRRSYFDHVNPDGYGPNYLVTRAGYTLPTWYSSSKSANNLESIGAGYGDANAVWQAWMGSPYHREHLLGSNSFYADQVQYGVGYALVENSPFGHYWVVITAPAP